MSQFSSTPTIDMGSISYLPELKKLSMFYLSQDKTQFFIKPNWYLTKVGVEKLIKELQEMHRSMS